MQILNRHPSIFAWIEKSLIPEKWDWANQIYLMHNAFINNMKVNLYYVAILY